MQTRILLLLAFLPALSQAAAAEAVHHELAVRLDPARSHLTVEDRMTFPEERETWRFLLHGDLRVEVEGDGALLVPEGRGQGAVPVARYRLDLPSGQRRVRLRYSGSIAHPLSELTEGFGRSMRQTPGTIGQQGAFLSAASYWYPVVPGRFVTFDLRLDLPSGWDAVSQGAGGAHDPRAAGSRRVAVSWREDHPQDDIVLVAAPFVRYRQAGEGVEAMAFLRTPDDALAARYLAATLRYLDLYRRLIGPYPYAKFALVENFWESGYGMPSFTLLGPRVLRLPFIIHTSYPHEVLHNWWGNSVYIDYAAGNWAEGLTAYLADHLLAEQRGAGADYRRTALARYLDFAASGRDFPLLDFHGRHGPVTQAVGYDKALMVFHMLRMRLGDDTFRAGLRRFFADNRFRVADWEALRSAFEAVSGEDLGGFFDQWLTRSGAPALRLAAVEAVQDGGWRLVVRLEQVQDGPAYALRVPLAVQLEGRDAPYETDVEMTAKQHTAALDLPARPLALSVDPRFDVFRRLDRREVPASLGQAFGAGAGLAVLPADAPEAVRDGYRRMVAAWQRGGEPWEVVDDTDLQALPAGRSVWLFGWDNRWAHALPAWERPDTALTATGARLAGEDYRRDAHALVVVDRRPRDPEQALVWVAAADPESHAGLARKLPHYGKYSFLAFAGEGPRNVAKGRWEVMDSPLRAVLGDARTAGPRVAPRPALIE
jgi:aminopeptidase N